MYLNEGGCSVKKLFCDESDPVIFETFGEGKAIIEKWMQKVEFLQNWTIPNTINHGFDFQIVGSYKYIREDLPLQNIKILIRTNTKWRSLSTNEGMFRLSSVVKAFQILKIVLSNRIRDCNYINRENGTCPLKGKCHNTIPCHCFSHFLNILQLSVTVSRFLSCLKEQKKMPCQIFAVTLTSQRKHQ